MKKIIVFISLVASLVSCSDDTETRGVSRVTNYPQITVLGDNPLFIAKGSQYVDPGALAMEGTNQISYTTSASGKFKGGTNVDSGVVDEYLVTYTATNVDGFEGKATRKVIVYENGDLINNISGIYKSTVTRNGVLTAQYTGLKYVYIWKNPDGKYELSDGIGGYYDLGRNYGVGYAATGAKITANDIPTNNFSYSAFSVGGFGGGCTMNSMVVNPTTKKITFNTIWSSGYTFNVSLEQVQF